MQRTRKRLNQNRRRFLTKPLKFFGIFIIALSTVTLFYFMWTVSKDDNSIVGAKFSNPFMFTLKKRNNKMIPFKAEKIVHLDLKGAAPKVSYYTELFPLLKKLGATGVLIEYEDMFPYSGILANISAFNAYSLKDIVTINSLAKENELKVIPLVQTFGNMAFILKLKEFRAYREVRGYPQVICPTHNNTKHLIKDMIKQTLKAHPYSQIIHIGADEVSYIGRCSRCRDVMSKYSYTKTLLYVEHINNIVSAITDFSPHMQILMSDELFRSLSQSELKGINLSGRIIPVISQYTQSGYDILEPSLLESYSKKFKNVWLATPFKGATGSDELLPDIYEYQINVRSWLSVVEDLNGVVNFSGIIITGWQRYDHFAVLCELFPVGIPSLAMSLRLLLGFEYSSDNPPIEVVKILRCQQPYPLLNTKSLGSLRCNFPGSSIIDDILHFEKIKEQLVKTLSNSKIVGWMNVYNIKHSFSNTAYVEEVIKLLNKDKTDLNKISQTLTISMSEVYDNFTVEEWKDTHIRPLEEKIEKMMNAAQKLLGRESWPRRPFNLDEL